MMNIVDISKEDLKSYKDIFSSANYLGMTSEEAVKLVYEDGIEKILFVCGPVWMIFSHADKKMEYSTFIVNDDKVVSFTKNDCQVNIYDNMVYLIYEDGKHESLQLFKNNDDQRDIGCNGLVTYMQYDSFKDVRCVSKYEHSAYGNCDRIYDIRLNVPFEVSLESKVTKRDKGMKFLGRKSAYYRLDFDVKDDKWKYDLSTISEFGIGAVLASDTISLHNGNKKFSRFCREILSVGEYITITGFPFLRQYTQSDIDEYVESKGFKARVSEELLNIFNNREKYTRDFQDIVLLYKSRMNAHHSIFQR